MKRRVLYTILIVTSVLSFSCNDFLTVEPENVIPENHAFKTADDAITAVYGLYALMQPCVDQLFLAGDVQSDLVVTARGADSYIAEIAQNRVSAQNPYTDYTNFYKLVCACNNAIAGLQDIVKLDPLNYSPDKYDYNVAEITCIRSWAYLQLVKIWGDVPYVENTVTLVDQITNIPASPGDEILVKIEKEMTDKAYPVLTTALNPSGMGNLYYTQFNNRSCPRLLADINLNLGNYVRASDILRPFGPWGFGMSIGNSTQLKFNWIKQFNNLFLGNFLYATQFIIQFDGSKGQKNNLMHWTSNINGGIFAVKPSSIAIKNWDSQGYIYASPTSSSVSWDGNGLPIINGYGDPRGNGASYLVNQKDTIISKYLLKDRYILRDPGQNDDQTNDDVLFHAYRNQTLYLDVAECYNIMGMTDMSLYALNGGIGIDGVRTNALVSCKVFDPANGDNYHQMENFILDEIGLEGAYEGLRWFALVRFAKRQNNPAILADAIAKKYPVAQQAGIKARLSNPDYWYWPYYYKNVAANKLLVQKTGY